MHVPSHIPRTPRAPRSRFAPLDIGSLGLLLCAGCASSGAGSAPGDSVAASVEALRPSPGQPTAEQLAELQWPFEWIEGEPMFTVLEADGIPALDLPDFVSAEEAGAFMQPEETVLGVVGRNGTAKCYSAWQLDSHEIVNDLLDGEPISATW